MKAPAIILLFAVLLAGCTEPVVVDPPPADNPGFELIPVPAADSTLPGAAVDTAGILPSDQRSFPGLLVIARTTHNTSLGRRTGAAARVLLEDRDRPVLFMNRPVGFWGVDLGGMTVNGAPMARIPHRVRVRRAGADSLLLAGVEYLRDMTGEYVPNTVYTWTASGFDSVASFSASVRTPDPLVVQSPVAGQVISRDREFILRWSGGGTMDIVLSGFDPGSRRVVPLLRLRPRLNTGRLPVPARVLRLLPVDRFRQFVVTFALVNRSAPITVGGYDAPVLAVASDVQNVFVEIR